MEYDAAALRDREGLNRRIAPRTPVEQLFVDVVYDEHRSFGRRPKERRLRVQVADVSIDGALLAGPERRDLRAGVVVAVEGPGRAVAEIRHASTRSGAAHYGVHFLAMDAAFRAVLFDHVGRHRPAMQDAWLNAR